jgi:hypothetical protein
MTTDSMRIAQFLCDLVGCVLKRANLIARQRIDEVGPRQASNLGGAALG